MVVSPALEGGLDQMAYRTLTVNDAKVTDGGSYMCRSTVHLKGEDPNWLHPQDSYYTEANLNSCNL